MLDADDLEAALGEILDDAFQDEPLPDDVDHLSDDVWERELPPDVEDLSGAERSDAGPLCAMPRRGQRHANKTSGVDRVKIAGLLKRKCGCPAPCGAQFQVEEVATWLDGFSELIKPDQDALLFSLARQAHTGAMAVQSCHARWQFLDKPVCRKVMFWLTGAERRLKAYRCYIRQGVDLPPPDLRQHDRLRKTPASIDALEFLRWLYDSVAETLPDVITDADLPRQGAVADDALTDSYSALLEQPLGKSSAGFDEPPTQLKHLPPGTWHEAWLLYRADREDRQVKAACIATFWSTWRKHFSHLLAHRRRNSFGKCNTCVKYKAVLKLVHTSEGRVWWSRQYSQHLLSQYRDRCVYYHRRELSTLLAQGRLHVETTLQLIVDALDQAKFCVPRHTPGAKQLQDCMRPRLHCVGVIAHGFLKMGYIIEPTIAKDSNVFVEVCMQSLHRVMLMCKERGLRPPDRIVIQADNAGDCKNQDVFAMMASLVVSGLCKVAVMCYLRTGHSHEDVDAMFGVWARHLSRQNVLQTPSDFRAALSQAFGLDTSFEVMDYVRNWQRYFDRLHVAVSGHGQSTNTAHSFTWLRRSSIDEERWGQVTSQFRDPAHPDDAVLLVRKYMHTGELVQAPLVALPACRLAQLGEGAPSLFVERLKYSQDQRTALYKTADILEQFPYNLSRAAAYLRALADERDHAWCALPLTTSVDFLSPVVPSEPLVVWKAPPNLIEPPESAKLIQAVHRLSDERRAPKRKPGRGRMNPQQADRVVPPAMYRGEGGADMPVVGLHGDLVGVD